MTILAKTYFCRQKLFLPVPFLAWKNRFFPPSGKNLPTLVLENISVFGWLFVVNGNL